jgi:hypothetical protein
MRFNLTHKFAVLNTRACRHLLSLDVLFPLKLCKYAVSSRVHANVAGQTEVSKSKWKQGRSSHCAIEDRHHSDCAVATAFIFTYMALG